ncbi:hypothetical protein LINPERHAP2_LOCUS9008, partial [Linum perenne]
KEITFSDKQINLCHLLLHTDAPNQFSSAPNQLSSAPNPISRLVAAIVSDYPHLRVLLSSPSSPIYPLPSSNFATLFVLLFSLHVDARIDSRLEQALTTIQEVKKMKGDIVTASLSKSPFVIYSSYSIVTTSLSKSPCLIVTRSFTRSKLISIGSHLQTRPCSPIYSVELIQGFS